MGAPARLDYVEIYPLQLLAPPATPAQLTLLPVSDSQIELDWEPSTGAGSYIIRRATLPDGPFTTIATGITTSAYADSSLTSGQIYYYTVTATNGAGSSLASAMCGAAPLAPSHAALLEAEADATVDRGGPSSNYGTATSLNAKNAPSTNIQRKGYLRFNLAGQTIASTPHAILRFAVTTWNQSATWQVLGLKDGDAGETWSETGITWNNAPANFTTSGELVDPTRTVSLGFLSLAGAQSAGAMAEFRSVALDDFLKADTNQKVTFILARSTLSDAANSAIASREHATYAGPTLLFDPMPITIAATRFHGSTFELDVTGLATSNTYVLKRSTDFGDGFPTRIEPPVTAASNAVFTDPSPLSHLGFYRVETAP